MLILFALEPLASASADECRVWRNLVVRSRRIGCESSNRLRVIALYECLVPPGSKSIDSKKKTSPSDSFLGVQWTKLGVLPPWTLL